MKNMKKLFALTAVLVLCLSFLLVPANAADDSKMLAEAKKAVVQIYGHYFNANGTPVGNGWTGSGFAVGQTGKDANYFVTNRHVVTTDTNYGGNGHVRVWILLDNCKIDSQTKEPERGKSVECEIVYTTDDYPDIALLMVKEPIAGFKPLRMLKSSELVADGSPVYALGYPGVVDAVSETQSGINDVTITDGIVSKHMTSPLWGNTQLVLHSATIQHGNSGGPLVNSQGQVVGLNTYGFGEQSTTEYSAAVYIDYVVNVLDRYNIKVDIDDSTAPAAPAEEEVPATTEPETPKVSPALIAGIVVGVLAVAGVVAFLLSKKKKAPAPDPTSPIPVPAPMTAPAGGNTAPAGRTAPAPAAVAEFKVRTPDGRIVSVGASGCTIGRSHECTLRLPDDANGVSRVHCKLEVKGSTLVVTDLGSSYGTLIHGKKIPANTPVALKVGSSFALASEKYTYTVV